MNTKKDDPGKQAGYPGGPGSNRPHATLDLKATEVQSKAAKEKMTSSESSDATKAGKSPAAGRADPVSTKAQEPTKSDSAKPQASASDTAARGSPGAGTRETPSAMKVPPAQKPQAKPRRHQIGLRSLFTHFAAGVAGGIVALLAIDLFAPQLGLTGGATDYSETTQAMQRRLSALEESVKSNAGAAKLAPQLAAAEARLGKLAQTVKALGQSQGETSGDVKSLSEKLGTEGTAENSQARISKLEGQLATLSAAAESDPQSGGLPQLASITGKIADLESTIASQLAALRKGVSQEIEARLSAVSEASEAARSGTQRIDRELATIKTDEAHLTARLDSLKAESDRDGATLQTTQQRLEDIRSDLIARLNAYAKPDDVSSAVAPVYAKVVALEQNVQGVVKSEEDRKVNAERILLALQLGNLKRAIDRGEGYVAQLAEARKLADGTIDLAPLDRFQDKGVPTLAELSQDLRAVAFKMIDAATIPADGSIVERLLAEARSVVRVRKVNHSLDDKGVEAVVGRMETALAEGRLGEVIDEAKSLPPPAAEAAKDFLAKVEAREAVDRALIAVDGQLKASLSTAKGATDKISE